MASPKIKPKIRAKLLNTRAEELTVGLWQMPGQWSRGEYFSGLFIVGCASGLASRIIRSVEEIGWAQASFKTFDISVIVLFSCVAGLALIARDPTRGVSSFEMALGTGFILLVILPIGLSDTILCLSLDTHL